MAATRRAIDGRFALMFTVMLTIAAANTALQSVLPALGRLLGVADRAVAVAFSVSGLLWVIAAPWWANRSDRHGRRAMILTGVAGFVTSLTICGAFLAAGINGWIAGGTAFGCFVVGRMIYGGIGAAAPPAVQALVAGETTPEERTRALTLLASAFGLGTILGPAAAPYLRLGHVGGIEIGLAGPAFVFAAIGAGVWLAVRLILPDDRPHPGEARPTRGKGAKTAYPSIGGAPTGASVAAATRPHVEQVGYLDKRVRGWMLAGLVTGHAQVMASQAIGFLVIDRLHVAPAAALEPTGIVLMMGAGASLLVQWGIIPLLDLKPRQLMLVGLAVAAAGSALTGLGTSLYAIATAYGLASIGFGFTRPGFTAGASLAVGDAAQGSVAGKVTSVNGACYVLGPSIGIGLYGVSHALPYLVAGGACLVMIGHAALALRAPPPPPAADAWADPEV
jgi:MFS family permease